MLFIVYCMFIHIFPLMCACSSGVDCISMRTNLWTDTACRFLCALTKEVHHKAIVVAVNVGGRVRLELDGDISCRCVELETRPRATVLAQYLSSQVVSIIECQQVIHSHVEAAGRQDTYLVNLSFTPSFLQHSRAVYFSYSASTSPLFCFILWSKKKAALYFLPFLSRSRPIVDFTNTDN